MQSRTIPGTPQAIKKQAKAAEELHEKIYGKPKSDSVEPTEKPAAQETQGTDGGGDIQPVEAPDARQASDQDTKTASPSPEKPLDSNEPVELKEPGKPEEKKPEAAPVEDWEKKYRVLQGKYNAEVPRLSADLAEMRGTIAGLEKALSARPEPEKKKEEAKQDKKQLVSQSDLEDYGEDLVDLIQRVARGEVAATTESLIPQIEEIKGQVTESTQKSRVSSVYAKLDSEIQDWREVNKSDGFIEWLSQSDPYVGDRRQALLTDAFQKGDASRVAAFFKGYKAEQKLFEPPAPAPSDTPAPAPKSNGSGVSLEQLAGPTGGPSATQASSQQKQLPVWTRAQIAEFYKDVQLNKFKSDPERKAQIETSIAAAMREGRVQ